MKAFLLLALVLLLTSCVKPAEEPERLILEPIALSDLPGWSEDKMAEAFPALMRSCEVLRAKDPATSLGRAGLIGDWQAVCATLAELPTHEDAALRQYFLTWFRAYTAKSSHGGDGLFTGYYEPELRGSKLRTPLYATPLYARPQDLVDVDLGDFKTSLHGQHIVGKVEKGHLKPYDDRATIEHGSLAGRAEPLLWVDDPVDAFFLAVQGSGRVRLPTGELLQVGYDGANGRAYVAIGRTLADMHEIEKPVTMQKIRQWLAGHPDRAKEIMNLNGSYVFFRLLNHQADQAEGPLGAEGVSLTPHRSLAVDPVFVPLGIPLWLDTQDASGGALHQLMVAQDTGGAIKGPVRGDFFWGAGPEAEAEAGSMQSSGHYSLLLPKTVAVDAE